jgi:hypothetical protein
MKINKIKLSVNNYNARRLKASKKFFITLFGVLLIILNIFFTLQMSSLGVKVAILEKTYTSLEKENNLLSTKLVESSSLIRLQEKSTQLGFAKAQESLYIKAEGVYTGYVH